MTPALAFAALVCAAFVLALVSEYRHAQAAGEAPPALAVAFGAAVLALLLAVWLMAAPAGPPAW